MLGELEVKGAREQEHMLLVWSGNKGCGTWVFCMHPPLPAGSTGEKHKGLSTVPLFQLLELCFHKQQG